MIPRRYLFATLFIAAMLVLVAVVQAPRARSEGGFTTEAPVALSLESFETLAELPLRDGWSPRFQDTQDPDQLEPWPFAGGFEGPWEPASPYLGDQGVALNGPDGHSEVVLWRGLEWRRYRFDAPLASARLDPLRGNRLLITLGLGRGRFETRLMEIPEGRVLWAVDSGPWSRFSWDGRAVLVGLPLERPEAGLLLSAIPAEGPEGAPTLASWDEPGLPGPPKGWVLRPGQLGEAEEDLPGAKVAIPWREGARLWFPRKDRLWTSSGGQWSLWSLEGGMWRRSASGPGVLAAQPPLHMGRTTLDGATAVRATAPLDGAAWTAVEAEAEAWPAYDPAWLWQGPAAAVTAWDQRWGAGGGSLARERQREALVRALRPEWRAATGLRASVRGWLPEGPEVALREGWGVAWAWVGDRILLVRLQGVDRLRQVKAALKAR